MYFLYRNERKQRFYEPFILEIRNNCKIIHFLTCIDNIAKKWHHTGRTLLVRKRLYFWQCMEYFEKKMGIVYGYSQSLEKILIRGEPRKFPAQFGSGSLILKIDFSWGTKQVLKI